MSKVINLEERRKKKEANKPREVEFIFTDGDKTHVIVIMATPQQEKELLAFLKENAERKEHE